MISQKQKFGCVCLLPKTQWLGTANEAKPQLRYHALPGPSGSGPDSLTAMLPLPYAVPSSPQHSFPRHGLVSGSSTPITHLLALPTRSLPMFSAPQNLSADVLTQPKEIRISGRLPWWSFPVRVNNSYQSAAFWSLRGLLYTSHCIITHLFRGLYPAKLWAP